MLLTVHLVALYLAKTKNWPQQSLTHLFPMHPFSTPDNLRKPYGFQGVEKKGALGTNGIR